MQFDENVERRVEVLQYVPRDHGVERVVLKWVRNVVEVVHDVGVGVRTPVNSDCPRHFPAPTSEVEHG
jgi:hypothetical protein